MIEDRLWDAWDNHDLTPSEKLVLLAHIMFADRNGVVKNMKASRISQMTGLTIAEVSQALNSMWQKHVFGDFQSGKVTYLNFTVGSDTRSDER